jgi:hypothetical protein
LRSFLRSLEKDEVSFEMLEHIAPTAANG